MKTIVMMACLCSLLFAQRRGAAEADSVISYMQEALKEGRFASVEEAGRNFVNENRRSQANETVIPLLLESFIQQGKYDSFNSLFPRYARRYTDSKYLGRLYYLEGIGLAKQQKYSDAFSSFQKAYDLSADSPQRIDVILRNSSKIIEDFLTLRELQSLNRSDIPVGLYEVYDYSLARRSADRTPARAEELWRGFRASYPESEFSSFVRDEPVGEIAGVAPVARRSRRDDGFIAALLPLSGQHSALGEIAKNAIELALSEHNSRTGESVEIRFVDTEANSVVTAVKLSALLEEGVSVVIGPLMSNTATVAASMLMAYPDVTLITPTATDAGIAALGRNIFQLNITPQAVASRVASYSIESLNIRDFVILAPLTEYGRQMATSFERAVVQFGGEVTVKEFFAPNATDLREQFTSIREYYLKDIPNSGPEDYVTVGGVFVPSTAAQGVSIAAQIPFQRIRTQLLGGNSWDNSTFILDGRGSVENSIFGASYSIDTDGARWERFQNSYRASTGTAPDRTVSPLFYDATSLVLQTQSRQSGRGTPLYQELGGVKSFEGVSGVISFYNTDGANSGVVVKKVINRQFIILE